MLRKLIIFSTLFSIQYVVEASENVGGGQGSFKDNSPAIQQAQEKYEKEILCVLNSANKKYNRSGATAKQIQRAKNFARTLAKVAGKWRPPQKASWRRHLYAQFVPETGLFSINTQATQKNGKVGHKVMACGSSRQDERYLGRGWIQLTHCGNYKNFACFKQNLNGQSLDKAGVQKALSTKICNGATHDPIVTHPKKSFEYDDNNPNAEANTNNDLASIFYFLKMERDNAKFREALANTSSRSVEIIRRGVNRGDPNSSKPGNDEDKAVSAFNNIGRCFQGA